MAKKNSNPAKKARADQRREEAKKKKTIRTWLWVGGVLLALAAVIALVIQQNPLPGEAVEIMKDQSHIDEPTSPHEPYNSDPPTSGPHTEYIANWGVHKEAVPFETLVHNLEDGGVVIYHSQSADADTVAQLEKLVGGYQERVVLAPYPEMKNAITLTAWGRIDRLEALDETRVVDFIEAFIGIDHHK